MFIYSCQTKSTQDIRNPATDFMYNLNISQHIDVFIYVFWVFCEVTYSLQLHRKKKWHVHTFPQFVQWKKNSHITALVVQETSSWEVSYLGEVELVWFHGWNRFQFVGTFVSSATQTWISRLILTNRQTQQVSSFFEICVFMFQVIASVALLIDQIW